MFRFALLVTAGMLIAACAQPIMSDRTWQPVTQDAGKEPAAATPVPPVNVPLSLSKGHTIGYASTGYGMGKVTAAYRVDEVTPGANGRYVLAYTETLAGDTARTRQGSAMLGGDIAFDRGTALSFQFLEPAGQETVTVQAGTFNATKYTNKGTPKYATFWVADGVVVKEVQTDVGGNKPGTGSAELAYVR